MNEPVTTQPKSSVVITPNDVRFTQPDSINGKPSPNLEESNQKNKQNSANQQRRKNTDETLDDIILTTEDQTLTTNKKKKRRSRNDGFDYNDDGLEEPVVAGTAGICFICDCCGNDSGGGGGGCCDCGDGCDCDCDCDCLD